MDEQNEWNTAPQIETFDGDVIRNHQIQISEGFVYSLYVTHTCCHVVAW